MSDDNVHRVLVVAPFYPPLPGARPIQAERAVAALRQCGADVRVVSGDERETHYTLRRYLNELALYGFVSSILVAGVRADIRQALADGWLPDVVLSMSVPFDAHLLGKRLSRRLGVPWAAFLSDPYPIGLAPGPYAARRKGVLNQYQLRVARRVLDGVDALLAPTQEILEIQHKAGLVAANTPLTETLHVALRQRGRPEADTCSGIYHIGQLTAERSSHAIIDAIRILARRAGEKPETLVFVGETDAGFREALAAEERNGIVRFEKSVDASRSRELMCAAKALLLIEADMQHGPFLPSKITDYAAAGRPIVVISNGNSALVRIVGNHQGVTCAAHDRDGIVEALVRASQSNVPSRLEPLFDAEHVGKRYLDGLRQARQHFRS